MWLKRLLIAVVVLCMGLWAVGCGKEEEPKTTEDAKKSAVESLEDAKKDIEEKDIDEEVEKLEEDIDVDL